MTHLKMQSMNKIDENVLKIAMLFPNCVTEAKAEDGSITHKIDFDMLKQELSNSLVEGREERYQFTWPDKKQAILTANAPINKTLRPCREESVDFDNTKNLYIEGDNLEVLKLLQETYLGKIKMIYIDPPYNTGNDFVYEDDFSQKAEDYIANSGQTDEEGNRLVANTESNGRFHTDWLNMIYPRLKIARDLLSDDGVIFISIDDNEVDNLRKVCDEIFGEINFLGEIIRKTKSMTADNGNGFNLQHENLIIYSKNRTQVYLSGELKTFSNYSNPDNDPNGDWCTADPSARSGGETTYFGIENPYTKKVDYPPNGRYWAFSKQTLKKYIHDGRIKFKEVYGENERGFIFKRYKNNMLIKTEPVNSLFAIENKYMNQAGTIELKTLFSGNYFSYPKPVDYIKKIIQFTNSDIILDFFSGSATTAHAVMQLNAEERQRLELSMENLDKNDPNYESKFQNLKSQLSHQRKFIMVQLPEKTDEKSEAYKAGYKNICEIGKERIRRAGKKILKFRTENLDFRIKSLEKEGVIVKYARELSEIRSLEEIYGCCGECLSSGEKTSERRDLRTVGSNASSSCVDSVEHSGRSVAGNKGIYPIFENSKGISFGTRDTVIDLRTLELLNQRGYKINFDYFGRNQQNDLFTDKDSDRQTLSSNLQALSSQLSVLSSLPDIGFRVLKCDSSNMQDVYYSSDDLSKQDLFKDNIKTDRSAEDLLFQVMLDLGIELSSKIETKKIDGKTVYYVSENYLVACFDDNVDEKTITEIAKEKPYYFVMRDSSMANDSVATNFEQIFKTYLGENYNPDNIKII